MKIHVLISSSLLLLLGLFFSKCTGDFLTDILFYNSDRTQNKLIRYYLKQSRDEQLQGWWSDENRKGDPKEYWIYFDVDKGKERTYYLGSKSYSTDFWYTKEGILYEMQKGDGGASVTELPYYIYNDTLKIFRWFWKRITDTNLLDSLKQYEF